MTLEVEMLCMQVWMRRMDKNMKIIGPILASTYGAQNVTLWTARWRGFFLGMLCVCVCVCACVCVCRGYENLQVRVRDV